MELHAILTMTGLELGTELFEKREGETSSPPSFVTNKSEVVLSPPRRAAGFGFKNNPNDIEPFYFTAGAGRVIIGKSSVRKGVTGRPSLL
jgi:hypothetical protein